MPATGGRKVIKVFGLFIGGRPMPQPRPRGRIMYVKGKPIVSIYESDNPNRQDPYGIKDWKQILCLGLNPLVPQDSIKGPVRVDASFYFERPAYMIQDPKYPDEPVFHPVRNDVDNIFKPLADVMTNLGFFSDDGQIAVTMTCKFFCHRNPMADYGTPGVHIRLYTLTHDDNPHCKSLFKAEAHA
jgi:Holliday junction resolvase RusA-like endonuclease